MTRPTALFQVAVLAYTPRSRELMRRVLRSMGYAPRVFSNFDELLQTGPRAARFEMLFLGDMPETDSHGRTILKELMAVIGPAVPVLHAPLKRPVRSRTRAVSVDGVHLASPLFFGDLVKAMLTFLVSHGFSSPSPRLAWGDYSFRPADCSVGIGASFVQLDPVSFDVALEFFHHAGRVLAIRHLERMLPSGTHGASWHRIDNLACTIADLRVAMQLDAALGWALEEVQAGSYRLQRSERRAEAGAAPGLPIRRGEPKAPARRRRAAVAMPVAQPVQASQDARVSLAGN
ncbi:hypothetical protein QTH87_07275 [Variovorax sp. J22P168]|uniref:hypothetical protein n=1 Tax=Variovorax jilinensis TaxID=3053513 RepID=UPI002577F158|nr:hypothetical protein [Variovorax sp. J22P168]MDM0012237.1 hypothetical protein [Variovorax sp. J22P168]